MTTPKQAQNFEEAITSLEDVVRKLESGNVPLEEAITLFQQGMELSKLCSTKLDIVEKQIQTITEQDGAIVTKPIVLDADK